MEHTSEKGSGPMDEMQVEEEAILTIKDVAEKAGIGTQKVHREIKEKNLKAYKIGWQWLINESDFIEWMEKRQKETESTNNN